MRVFPKGESASLFEGSHHPKINDNIDDTNNVSNKNGREGLNENKSADITWCPFKPFDFDAFQKYLTTSVRARHLTNGGPLQKVLASRLASLTGSSRVVVPVASGTAALHALAYAWTLHLGRRLRWATQAFTFPSSMQAALADALVVDLDAQHHGPSIRDLEANKDSIDGIIVTNVFGLSADLSTYEAWCVKNQKLMLLDNAATPMGKIKEKSIHDYGDGAIVSLHETKAIGRGEGGAAFIPEKLERDFHRVICFGFDVAHGKRIGSPLASNFKLSDISAAAALSYLDHLQATNALGHLSRLSVYAEAEVEKLKNVSIAPWRVHEPRLWGCLPLMLSGEVDAEAVCEALNSLPRRIESKRYYRPLTEDRERAKTAWSVFDRTICLPLHTDMSFEDVTFALSALAKVLGGGRKGRGGGKEGGGGGTDRPLDDEGAIKAFY